MKYAIQGKDLHAEAWKKDPNKYKEAREKVLFDTVLHTTAAGVEGQLDGLGKETSLFNSQTRCVEGKRCNIGPSPGVLPKEADVTVYAVEAEVIMDDRASFLALMDDFDLVIENAEKKELLRRRLRECQQVGGLGGFVAIDGNAAAEIEQYYKNGNSRTFAVPLHFPICLTAGSQLKAKLVAREKAVDAASEPYEVVNALALRKTLSIRLHCLEYVLTNPAG